MTRANNQKQYSVVLIKRRDLSCKNSFVESITSQHTEQCNSVMGRFLYLSYYFYFGCNTVILADPYSWGTAMRRTILSVGAFVWDIFSSTRVQHGLVLTSEMQKRPNTNTIPTFHCDVIWHHVVSCHSMNLLLLYFHMASSIYCRANCCPVQRGFWVVKEVVLQMLTEQKGSPPNLTAAQMTLSEMT